MKITLNHLTKIFPNRKKKAPDVIAVNDMSIEIPSGKLVGLLGPSGCGKSTTLFMLSGLEQPSKGSILFDNQDVTTLAAERRGIGLVFQNYALYPHMTVEQNIAFPLTNMRMPKAEAKARALDVAKLVQIEDLMARKPSELSGGQQQRVAIARALAKMPNVLLLDEPLSNLDARLRLQTREEIKRIQRETGITTVFVTHDQEEAMSICDIMVVMKLGVVQQIGEPQNIYDNPANLFVAKFLGTPPINVFNGVIRDGKLFIGEEEIMDVSDLQLDEKVEEIVEVPVEETVDESVEEIVEESVTEINEEATEAEAPAQEVVEEPENRERKVFVGIRPEGFIYDEENGVFTLDVTRIEVMGRDKSIVSTHAEGVSETIRTIIDSDVKLPEGATQLKFSLKPNKVHIFDAETEERIK